MGSNCTLLELKQSSANLVGITRTVQIVPCWNWNKDTYTTRIPLRGSNCTLLELKREKRESLRRSHSRVQIVPCWNWNKKWKECDWSEQYVQIVPCWNWNMFEGLGQESILTVQIVPCWNWNIFLASTSAFRRMFKLYLAGIETDKQFLTISSNFVQIVPCWNWNRKS